jgi:tRNA(fMet)-specific endonuclease VapC
VIYLLDTDICVEVLRRRGPAARRVEETSPADLAISVMTEAELEYGVIRHPDRARARARLDRLLEAPIEILPFDRPAARIHARVRHDLRATPIGPHDLIIAAIALAGGLTIVTHNVAEFARVPGLTVEDWTRSGDVDGEAEAVP